MSVSVRQKMAFAFSPQICEFYRFQFRRVCSQFCCTFFNNEISFIKLFHELRSSKNCADELKSVKKLRSTANNVSDFDKSLDKLINLFTIQPQQDYPDSKLIFQLSNIFFLFFSLSNIFFHPKSHISPFSVNTAWMRFQNMFVSIEGMLLFEPIYKAFHIRMLEELYEDNVMYAELRTGLSPVNSFLKCFY